MTPIIGQAIVIAVICIVTFFAARETIRNIRAELRGEATCAGCSGCGSKTSRCELSGGAGCGKADCQACMLKMEELKKLRKD